MSVVSKAKLQPTFSGNKIKWVKKANMWCRSYWDNDNKLHQEWTIDKPKEDLEKVV